MHGRPDAHLRTPSRLHLAREVLSPKELIRLAVKSPQLAGLPRGSASVLAIPGFGSSDVATVPIRRFLTALGHRAHGWNLGVNTGDVEASVVQMIERVETIAKADEHAAEDGVALIGWSLGGVIGREVARDRPDLISRVITYGTPVIGGPKYTASADAFGAERTEQIAIQVAERNLIPIEVPITAMYSRLDGIVNWRACLDDFSPRVENVRIGSTHIGMGIDPDVWATVADRLATRAEQR